MVKGPHDLPKKLIRVDRDSTENKSKKTTVNLSVDSNIIDKLKEESSFKGLSLNAHISSILDRHVNFFSHALNHGVVMFPSDQWAAFLEVMDKKTIIEILENIGIPTVLSLFSHNNVPITVDTMIRYCFERIALLTGCYSSFNHHKNENGEICLVFEHRFNNKWSEILAEVFSDMIEKTLGQKCTSVTNPNTLLLKIMQTVR
jgi:hypothetical protein